MKKYIICFLFLTASFLSNVSAQDYPADIQKIIDKNKLVIALYEKDQPPFFMADKNGELQGFDIELAKGIADELGVIAEFNKSAKTFNETVDLVVNGQADIVISKLSRTLKRAKRVLFTKPYIVLRKGLLVNRLKVAQAAKGMGQARFIKNITGNIGVIADTSYVGYAKTMFPKADITEYPDWKDVVTAVTKGNIIAAFRDELELKKIIKDKSDAIITLQTVIFKDTKDPISIAVSSDSPHLCFWINQYLDEKNIYTDVDELLDRFQFMSKEKDKK